MPDALRPTTEIAFPDQSTDGTVRIAHVEMAEPGFVAIHDYGFWDGMHPESSLGATALDAGSHDDVAVELDEPIAEPQHLLAVRHLDDPETGTYRWDEADGSEDPVSPSVFGATGEIGILGHAHVTPEREPERE
jgi:hypothetical protein